MADSRPPGAAAAPKRTAGHSHYIDISTVAHSSPFVAVFIGAATLLAVYVAARYANHYLLRSSVK